MSTLLVALISALLSSFVTVIILSMLALSSQISQEEERRNQ